MKILMVTDKMDIGGAETHIFTLITELAKRGDTVTVLSSGGAFAQRLKENGIEVRLSPLDKRDPISVIRCVRDLGEQMRHCDVVHTHTRFSSFLASRVRGKRSFPPIVVTAHLNFKLFPFGALAYWGDRTLAVSEDIKDYLLKNYRLSEGQIHVTRNSLDLSAYAEKRSPKKLIMHTSRIDKGRAATAFMLCDIAVRLLSVHPDWRIMIVGDGNLFARLKKRADEVNRTLGFEGVMLCGARYDIPSLLRHGAIFVGVSRSALEGMAAGLPTIICGDEGYGGVLTKGNYSLLFKTNFCARGQKKATAELLFSDVERLINDESALTSLSKYARQMAECDFSARIMTADAESCYNLTRRAPSLCLLGYFGYGNLGDESIMQTALAMLCEAGIRHVRVLVRDKTRATVSHPCGAFLTFYDRMNPHDVIRAIESSDALVLCGGNLLQNETSLASLLYYSQLVRYAKSRGCRIYILSGGFGEIHGAYAKYLTAKCLSRSDFCGCRTSYDLEFAKGYARRAALMPDTCFLLDAPAKDAPKAAFAWIVSRESAIPTDDVLYISQKRKLKPIAIMLNCEEDEVRREQITKHGIEIFTPATYTEFCETIATCAFTVSERLHGAIFSLTCRIPAYLTANSVKKRALISEVNGIVPDGKLLLPYSRGAVSAKKEIGAQVSDFNYLIDFERREIYNALSKIF